MSLQVFLLHFLLSVCAADVLQMVHHFETLDSADLHVVTRKRRGAEGILLNIKHISFQTLGRDFKMVLIPGSSAIGPDFKATTIERDGTTDTFFVDPNNFYTGFLEDDRTIEIDAHFDDGILSATIHFPNETYIVEPAWRLRLTSRNTTMISYRRSDVNWDEIFPIDPKTGKRTSMMDGVRVSEVEPLNNERTIDREKNRRSRHKRAATLNNCGLLVVADFLFFRDMGNRTRRTTAAIIILTIQNANRYFRRTVWDSEKYYVNMGFFIKKMIIHTEFTLEPGHYNAEQTWDYNQRLKAFSRFDKVDSFCLGHLMSSYGYDDNVLGLAYTGSVCSAAVLEDEELLFQKVSWSTSKTSRGDSVLGSQFELVVTHELGHNWGAEHDPSTPECAPEKGKYIMWAIAVLGYSENNKHFSPCSKRDVFAVLMKKSSTCFDENKNLQGLCGNGIIELYEECDPGVLEGGEEDPCCTDNCCLREGAICSDFNHDCCKDCQVANTSVKCGERNNLVCKDETFCDGHSLECPQLEKLPDNTSCIDMGICFNGSCLNFCVIYGKSKGKNLSPCLCTDDSSTMCHRCCMEMNGTEQKECLSSNVRQPAGRMCLFGTCDENGNCIAVEKQRNLHIYKFVSDLTVSRLEEFMRTNMVGTVIVLSLLLWIPLSLIISEVDRRRRRAIEMSFDVQTMRYTHNQICQEMDQEELCKDATCQVIDNGKLTEDFESNSGTNSSSL